MKKIIHLSILTIFVQCNSYDEKIEHRLVVKNTESEVKQLRGKNELTWIEYKAKRPCEKIEILQRGDSVKGLFFDSVIIDMCKLTKTGSSTIQGSWGLTYVSVEDYKSDLKKWKRVLNCQ
jgi:hypothetical protein